MEQTRKPKLIAGLLATGIIVLGGGGILAATLPSADGPLAMMAVTAAQTASESAGKSAATTPPATGSPATSTPVPSAVAPPAPLPPITYTVLRGDTLSGIVAWFALHGYGDLYAANIDVIGNNPDLIIPGETITISGGGMVLSPAG